MAGFALSQKRPRVSTSKTEVQQDLLGLHYCLPLAHCKPLEAHQLRELRCKGLPFITITGSWEPPGAECYESMCKLLHSPSAVTDPLSKLGICSDISHFWSVIGYIYSEIKDPGCGWPRVS